ncbi:MAG: zinc-binding dehydrogenase [Nitrososphaerales archaeon]
MVKGAVFLKANYPFEIKDFDIPAIENNSLLVKVSMSNICGSDLHFWKGEVKIPTPIILGHEAVGRIEKLGKRNRDMMGNKVKEGDKVIYKYFYHCNHCYPCSLGDYTACENRVALGVNQRCDIYPYLNGAMAEYIYLRGENIFLKVPEDISDEEVSSANCALATIIQALYRGNLSFGDNVIVMGAGALGLYACSFSKALGAKVLCLDLSDYRLKSAEIFGADVTINSSSYDQEDLIRDVRKRFGDMGADVVIGLTGSPKLVDLGLRMLRKGGRFIEVGTISDNSYGSLDFGRMVYSSQKIITSLNYESWCLVKALRFIERYRDRYPFKDMVSHKFELSKIDEAFKVADSRKARRVAIIP